MKAPMTRPVHDCLVLLVVAFLIIPSSLLAIDITSPGKGRIVEDSTYQSSSVLDILSGSYGDLLAVHNSENSRKKELRLAMALRIYDTTYNQINATSSQNPNQKRFLPSPEALLKIEKMLASLDTSPENVSDSDYVNAMRNNLNTLGTPAENELIMGVIEDIRNNKDTIQGLNPDSEQNLPDQVLNNDNASTDEEVTDDSDIEPDVDVPDDEPDRAGEDNSVYTDNSFEEDLQNTTSDALTPSEIADWSDQELADRISALSELSGSEDSNDNLALMQEQQESRDEEERNNSVTNDSSDNVDTSTVSSLPGTEASSQSSNVPTPTEPSQNNENEEDQRGSAEEEGRASEIASMMSGGTTVSLFDSALVNMTDFFHTNKDSEEDPDQAGSGVFDPLTLKELSQDDIDGMNITDNFDTELVQSGNDEGISERNVSE